MSRRKQYIKAKQQKHNLDLTKFVGYSVFDGRDEWGRAANLCWKYTHDPRTRPKEYENEGYFGTMYTT